MRAFPLRAAAALAGLLLVAGCGPDGGDSGAPAAAPRDDAVLAIAGSDLGEIVVDAGGRTVYVFDKDTAKAGTSACAGQCLDTWPPVTSDTADPAVDGVTGDVGTIEWDDGTLQVTLDGWPLYRFAGDADAGDTAGQGVQGVWWAVGPDGARISEPAAPADVPAY